MVRAVVMPAPDRPLELRELPEPDLEPGAVLLRVTYAEICGTDVHLHHGRLSGVPYPIIPGHVAVGVVERVRGDVRDAEGDPVREGETVTYYDVHESCGACWHCLVARTETRCPSRRVYGITYPAAQGLLGAWAEKVYLKPGVRVIKLPAGLTPLEYIGGGCGLPTAFHAVERADLRMGDTVVVQGAGPVGLAAAVFAGLRGACEVIVIGAPAVRLERARALGATATFDIDALPAEGRIEAVRALTRGRGADVVIEASGNPAAIAEGMRMARDGGTYVVAGHYTDNGPSLVHPHHDLNRKHLDVRGCWGSGYAHFHLSIRLMARWRERFDFGSIVSRVVSLAEIPAALASVERGEAVKVAVAP